MRQLPTPASANFLLTLLLSLLALPALAGINRWTFDGPYGGSVTAVVADPSNPEILYACTGGRFFTQYGGGVYKSTDGGATWFSINNGIPPSHLTCIAILPTTPPVLLTSGDSSTSLDAYRSADGGATWSKASASLSSSALLVDPSQPATVYSSGASLFKSTDAGLTWRRIWNGVPENLKNCLALSPSRPSTLYLAGGTDAVYKSTDGGELWAPPSEELKGKQVKALAVSPADAETVYAGTTTGAGNGQLYKSMDGGGHWMAIGGGLPPMPVATLLIDPEAPETLYAGLFEDAFGGGAAGIYKSTDGGATWSAKSRGLAHLAVFGLTWVPGTPRKLVASTQSGIFLSTDGGESWRDSSRGIDNAWVLDLAIDAANPARRFAATTAGLYRSEDGGKTWGFSGEGMGSRVAWRVALDPWKPERVFAIGYDLQLDQQMGGLLRSLDGGAHWAPCDLDSENWSYSLLVDPTMPDTAYVDNTAGFFRTTDGGDTWACLAQANPEPELGHFCALAMDAHAPSILYGGNLLQCGPKRSLDGGITWERIDDEIPSARVFSLAVDPRARGTVYGAALIITSAMSLSGVIKSSDGGLTWGWVGTTVYSIASVAFDPTGPGTLYAARVSRDPSPFMTRDDGATWVPIYRGLSNRRANVLVVDPIAPDTVCAGIGPGHLYHSDGLASLGSGCGVYSFTYKDVPPPVVTKIKPLTGPYRLTITGSNFHASAQVLVNGKPVPETVYKKGSALVAKGGAELKAMLPKGVIKYIQVENLDDGSISAYLPFTRE